MVLLRRIVRMGLGADGREGGAGVANGYGGVPVFAGWPRGRHVEVEVCCRGEVDGATGYFIDIKAIDRATRGVLEVSLLESIGGGRGEVAALAACVGGVNGALGGRLAWMKWNVTPTYSVEVSPMETNVALLRQKFEIAAAHRLHVPSLSDDENRRLFGRCANPSGHGHNYIIEPCVEVPVGSAFGLVALERVTGETLVDPFDHRNLNTDCAQFDQSRGGVNPSVENISRVFYGLLAPAVERAGGGVRLRSITVWETEKTSSTFPG